MSYYQLSTQDLLSINTLGELKKAGYEAQSIHGELRRNLITHIKAKKSVFEGIWGYEDTVIPDVQRAILSQHHINLLGLRGQAKTRIARLMIDLLDEVVPMVAGAELNDDPLAPISLYAKQLIAEKGDQTSIEWIHRNERYTEKLATPDVSVADLIGDVDPIKAANLKLSYADERVIHYGLIPRANRGIFVINELPDLQARIQVSLFNILQEGDIQIRGFKLRLPLDIQFVFTANPEDYTNRGSIVTPLKDRIDSQIITHYPKNIEIGKKITQQEARISAQQKEIVRVNPMLENLIEEIAMEARTSEYVDAKSGVSARLTISAYENLISAAERRALVNSEKNTQARIADFVGIVPSITGKIELVYEGEQEGALVVAQNLIGKAVRKMFMGFFPDPEKIKKQKGANPYKPITDWFGAGNVTDILNDCTEQEYKNALFKVVGLSELIELYHSSEDYATKLLLMEFALHGLAEYSMLSRNSLHTGFEFRDLLSSMFQMPSAYDDDDDEDYDDDDDDDDNKGGGFRR
ncbi:MAG: magnesium chelatase [Cytophagales bacterium]|nr:MAG: magnesium chelatase [Cytophagales bacterium]